MALIFLAAIYGAQVGARAVFSRAYASSVNSTTCNGNEYVYEELAGYGLIASDALDQFGDTLGGLGSAIHLESWERLDNGSYIGTLWSLPDRGWYVSLQPGHSTQYREHVLTAVGTGTLRAL
jgi:hypothetical protein